MSYEILPHVLPFVSIFCRDDNRREEIIVLEDCTGWDLPAVLEACNSAHDEWLRGGEE